jgi:hypothetical protein
MFLTATLRDDNGQSVGIIILREKVFKSGKTGFHGQGKLALDGQRYQAQAQLVAIAAKSDTGGVETEG